METIQLHDRLIHHFFCALVYQQFCRIGAIFARRAIFKRQEFRMFVKKETSSPSPSPPPLPQREEFLHLWFRRRLIYLFSRITVRIRDKHFTTDPISLGLEGEICITLHAVHALSMVSRKKKKKQRRYTKVFFVQRSFGYVCIIKWRPEILRRIL